MSPHKMPEDIKIALPLLEEPVRLEPNYAGARAHMAWCYELRFTRGGLNEADKLAALNRARSLSVQTMQRRRRWICDRSVRCRE
jgi:hypothetical protein